MLISQVGNIQPLDESNYSVWKEKIESFLTLGDLDYALHNARPTPPQEGEPNYEHKVMKYDLDKRMWEQSNKKSLLLIKLSIVDNIKSSITQCDTAREYLDRIAAQFVGSAKAYASTLTRQFVNLKYDGSGIRAHIQKMSSMAAKLNKYFNAPLPKEFVVHIIMQSLPKEYETFHVNYNNSVKDQWSLDQLMAQCVQEEERLKIHKGESVNMAKDKDKSKKKNFYSRPHFKKSRNDGHFGHPGQGSSRHFEH